MTVRKNIGNENTFHFDIDGLELVQFRNLNQYENFVVHCFTTRNGGVSADECGTLNLGFNRNDSRENVNENYRRVANALKIKCEDMVLSRQVHDNKIRAVDEEDKGKGIFRENDLVGFDGLITNKKGIALVTFYADCVPVFFLDPQKKVIALSHSGWRGTVKEIARETIEKMVKEYQCARGDIEVAIGPSIGHCCFEVGDEVYSEFVSRLEWTEKFCIKTSSDKWHINLQEIIKTTLLNSGVLEDNICLSGICTRCNKDVFYSHRGDKGKTGSLAAIIQLI